jgi:predicted lipopolysaccharide heptosyltransferase III
VTILLVRLRLIGDVIFTTPLIRALRRTHPGARLTYLVETSACPVVDENPHLDDVIAVEHTRGWRRIRDDLRLALSLRRRRFDVAIDLHGGPRSAWLTWATRARVRVGYDVPGRSWMYTRTVHRPRELRPRHSVVNQWDLLSVVDTALTGMPEPDRDCVEMEAGDEARRCVKARLDGLGVTGRDRVAVVHVSAGNPFRRWPEAAFGELVAGLATAAANRWVLVTSGPSDHDAAARVVTGARSQIGAAGSRVVDAEGLSLKELRAMMDRAAVFVGGDSGPLHIAATSSVPIVGLYGPTLPERSAPWRPDSLATTSIDAGPLPCRPCDQRVCEPGDYRCLTTIPASRILAAAEQLLEGAR